MVLEVVAHFHLAGKINEERYIASPQSNEIGSDTHPIDADYLSNKAWTSQPSFIATKSPARKPSAIRATMPGLMGALIFYQEIEPVPILSLTMVSNTRDANAFMYHLGIKGSLDIVEEKTKSSVCHTCDNELAVKNVEHAPFTVHIWKQILLRPVTAK